MAVEARPEAGSDDTGDVIHEEIGRLPESLRAPVVLCWLEGQSCSDAAAYLEIPAGTVKSRLSRARVCLRGRLMRRGLAPTSSAFSAILASETARAAVPPSLAEVTLRALASHASAPGLVSAAAQSLTERTIAIMFRVRLARVAISVLAIVVFSAGAVGLACQSPVPASPRPGETQPTSVPSGETAAARSDKSPLDANADRQWATIRGRVVYDGDGRLRAISVLRGDRQVKDFAVVAQENILTDDLIVHPKSHGLANAVVFFPRPTRVRDTAIAAAAATTTEFQTDRGRFSPHVLVAFESSFIRLVNDDPIAYSVNVRSKIHPLNLALRPGTTGMKIKLTWRESNPVPVACDIHPWMSAWWFVADNPYFAVTDENGDFVIRDVPIGRQTLVVWHETAGEVTPAGGVGLNVTAGETVLLPFVLEESKISRGPAAMQLRSRAKSAIERAKHAGPSPEQVLERRVNEQERRLEEMDRKIDRILKSMEEDKGKRAAP